MNQEDIDEVEASKAPLIEHLIELRSRLIKSVIAVLIAFFICIYFASDIFNILIRPYEWAAGPQHPLELIYTAPQEYFFTQLKLALFGAMFLAFPVIATQIYMFVAPGLYKNERGAFLPYLFATPILFAIGACLVYFLVMPMAMTFFLSMEQAGTATQAAIKHLPKVSEYLGLIMVLIFAFGLVFQLPVVLTLLARVDLISSQTLKEKRKWAIVITFIMAAVLTPPDPISQIGLAIPTLLLYEFSILAVKFVERRREQARAERDAA
ncbi:twin-arginine translocase subunit TatC [Breoghania sp. JC706]|uniref:twin-arginine translocase subunit TatC n=1 Tax=Breoghania sp. JC706 TaxID=3117732 RepID=UPI0030088B58